MNEAAGQVRVRVGRLSLAGMGGIALLVLLLLALQSNVQEVRADPIPPPAGVPKLKFSVKTVSPTLAHTGGVTLAYVIELRNTGAYSAEGTIVEDILPEGTRYNGDLESSVPFSLTLGEDGFTWVGEVGFDSTAEIRFSVSVSPTVSGTVRNTAVISHPLLAEAVTCTAETMVADGPVFSIEKSSWPARPGGGKLLVYTLQVSNRGQPVANLPITVTDRVPLSTTLDSIGGGGFTSPISDVVTWTRSISLALGQSSLFTFEVAVDDVPSGTVISNDDYRVASAETGMAAGEPYTVTVVDPIFHLSKSSFPDPPGSNRELTYTIRVLNVGSLATDLVITDRVPTGVEYRRGGSEENGVVSWTWPSLATGESARFSYTVYVSNVMLVPIVNRDYGVCSSEGACKAGAVYTSVVQGPIFEVWAILDPIAHKPGGGTGTYVTPTLVVHNVGNGNALEAQATLIFGRISVSANDLYAIPPIGTPPPFPEGPDLGEFYRTYLWVGDLGHGEMVTFTTHDGQSTIGGAEWTPYTATIVITDALDNMGAGPASATAIGHVTHFAYLVPEKRAPAVIGAGQILPYEISVYNRGLSTQLAPVLTDVVPMRTTFVWASHGGVTRTVSDTIYVSWTLPLLGPGEGVVREFRVLVDEDLVSGTEIINDEYSVFGYGNVLTGALTSGEAVRTRVVEVGLVDSFKEVTPKVAWPGPGNVLTYTVHIVNSSPVSLSDVMVYDQLPWESSTYQRDAAASAGEVISDIVSVSWLGDVAAYSAEVLTFTVLVDPDFEGLITNTAVITHPDLLNEVIVEAVAYIIDKPVLRISKRAEPDPVESGGELAYAIQVVNLGQQATDLVITDVVPINTDYVLGSASGGGYLIGDQVHWATAVLAPGESQDFSFRVRVGSGSQVVNDRYVVRCAEGVSAAGKPVITEIASQDVYLPCVFRD